LPYKAVGPYWTCPVATLVRDQRMVAEAPVTFVAVGPAVMLNAVCANDMPEKRSPKETVTAKTFAFIALPLRRWWAFAI